MTLDINEFEIERYQPLKDNIVQKIIFTYIFKIDTLMQETDRLTFFDFFLSSIITNDNLSSYNIFLNTILSFYAKQYSAFVIIIRHKISFYPLRYFYFKYSTICCKKIEPEFNF